MNKIIFLILFVFFLTTGVTSGIAYERYINREECLKLAFDNSGVESLSEEEITEILRALNNGNDAVDSVAATTEPTEEKGGEVDTQKKAFVGSRNSNKFYPADCRYAKLIKEENKVFFNSPEEGEKAGKIYVKCK